MIRKIPINDGWLYSKGFNENCLELDYDWSGSYIVQLPHNVECKDSSYFDERNMRLVSTYSRVLTVPDSYNGKRLLLGLEGVLSYVEVYVNGTFVTSHKGEAPFYADITAPVKYNYENRIVLKVDSNLQPQVPCCGTRGPLTLFGGISREATFMICDGRDIKDVCVRCGAEGNISTVTADVEMFDYYPGTELSGDILDATGKKVGGFTSRSVQANVMRLRGECSEVICWEPNNPVLYTAVIKLNGGKKVLDVKHVTFGFAVARFNKDGFYLNGKLTRLIGLNRADCYPTIGRSATSLTERRDARIIKQSGCNAVRTMGQAGSDFIDECNKIGLMVIEDVYGDGYIGGAEWRDSFIGNVTDMIIRDRNNPCIIGWGIRVNNSLDCDELYFKVHKAAREADPTRATVGARNFITSRNIEDVFAYNQTHRAGRKLRRGGKLFAPYIIGEHSGKSVPTRNYDPESVRLNQALSHLSAINDVMGGAASGAFGMSFCDFATGRFKGNGDGRCYYGVFDEYRNPKLAAYAYISQTEDKPVMELSSDLSADDFGGKLYVFTNADKVILYRNNEKAGEFLPDKAHWKNLKHPPVVISDFVGNLPSAELGDGFKLKLFKSLLAVAEKKGSPCLCYGGLRETLLRVFGKIDKYALYELIEKYLRFPPRGAEYRFEGVYGGETKIMRVLTPSVNKTVKADWGGGSELHCTKTYERIAFTLSAEDGNGNVLPYCFMPVSVYATGSLAVEGTHSVSLKGGKGGFFVKSVSQGAGTVVIKSDCGIQTYDFNCTYEPHERF